MAWNDHFTFETDRLIAVKFEWPNNLQQLKLDFYINFYRKPTEDSDINERTRWLGVKCDKFNEKKKYTLKVTVEQIESWCDNDAFLFASQMQCTIADNHRKLPRRMGEIVCDSLSLS